MLAIISPAKKLDYDTPPVTETYTQPQFIDQAHILIKNMREYSLEEVARLMKLSTNLAELNVARYLNWQPEFTPDNAKQALLAFRGDVFQSMKPETFSAADFEYAQNSLRILSGLYGLLRPLDLMQPYRLEMGTQVPTDYGNDLYEFWGTTLTNTLNEVMEAHGHEYLVNLASNEYFKALQPAGLKKKLIHVVFKENRDGKLKVIGLLAKRARGMMSRYMIQNQVRTPDELKAFHEADYVFRDDLSDDTQFVFTR